MDLISRQAAIDAANDWLLDCLKVQKQNRSCGLIRRLEDLPSAQPEQRWIPLSERLPELYKKVLVTDIEHDVYIWSRVAIYGNPDAWLWEDDYGYFQDSTDVIAWMPLPEAYRKGKNGTACKEKM